MWMKERGDEIGRISHENMEENFQILSNEKNENGTPYRILRVPCPPPLIWNITPKSFAGEMIPIIYPPAEHREEFKVVLAASYLNFLIANETILMPNI